MRDKRETDKKGTSVGQTSCILDDTPEFNAHSSSPESPKIGSDTKVGVNSVERYNRKSRVSDKQ